MFRQWVWIGVLVLIGVPLWAQEGERGFHVESTETASEHRVALVIGNATYSQRPLQNPINDADSVAQALRECGFTTVLQHTDLDLDSMNTAVYNFGQMMEEGGVGLFYYSGHGIQVNGGNYLVPVSAEIQKEFQVKTRCFNMDEVLGAMNEAKNRVNILILDACRDNPFERRIKSSGRSGGLAGMDAPSGTFIAYAAAPGRTADDGDGSNSPFTEALVKEMRTAGSTIEDVFRVVGDSVERTTNQGQVPWTASSLRGDPFYFVLPPVRPDPSIHPNPDPPIIQTEEELQQVRLAREMDEFSQQVGHRPSENAVTNNGQTDLHFAAKLNLPVLTKSLLNQRADVNARDKYGMAPLHVAAAKNAHEIVEILLNHGANINEKDENSWKPLDWAMIPSNAHKTVKVLLNHGANINEKDDNGRTRLHWAAKNNRHKTADRLLQYDANPNVKADDGATPLHWAAKENAYETADVLLKHDANPNARKRGVGMTPLHVAAVFNSHKTADVLLKHDANPNATANNVTPLHVAAARDAYDTAVILLEYGANVDARNNSGATPLWIARRNNADRTANLLVQKGGQIR